MLTDYDPFDIFDAEAARLDEHFATLDADGWAQPSKCAGWSVRDVLAHLAGEELYNHAVLDNRVGELFTRLQGEGIAGFDEFNDWCVRQRRDMPVADVLTEWRAKNGETRRRMRELGRDAMVETAAGPYPNGLQAFHYDSEYATHADDVGAPVAPDEAAYRVAWRVEVGLLALSEHGGKAQVEQTSDLVRVHVDGETAELSLPQFVAATVGRAQDVDERIAAALRCLA
ncbi:maleylpyruvate isomerase family mycothiol-dependent enzyme [Nonomuraea sp. NPDC050556]|uniref:maleylpyruvate isomerase family mycothiol-dependent enzyme n=1 Tax=Nonomuraea sp. NPDC050556 TaxID=3364369 RepID=UPI00378E942E